VPKDPALDLSTTPGRDAWAHLVTFPDQGLVALDYDGTLAPIVARPEDAVAQPGIVDALAALAEHGVAVAVITGRPVDAALSLGRLDAVPGLVLLGHYGLQRWQDGELSSPEPGPGVATARERLVAYVAAHDPGMTVEDKHHSVALHTRNAADPAGSFAAATPMAQSLAQECDLELVPGRYVLELRPAGTDKGGALRAVVQQTGARAVLFGGDDLGDLPAVAATADLRAGGVHAMVVCSDSAETPAQLRQAADLVVTGPPGVLSVLRALESDIVAAARPE
jgi:trehalose 6-phosphate phosphatase